MPSPPLCYRGMASDHDSRSGCDPIMRRLHSPTPNIWGGWGEFRIMETGIRGLMPSSALEIRCNYADVASIVANRLTNDLFVRQ